jgi:hypothetical protein
VWWTVTWFVTGEQCFGLFLLVGVWALWIYDTQQNKKEALMNLSYSLVKIDTNRFYSCSLFVLGIGRRAEW